MAFNLFMQFVDNDDLIFKGPVSSSSRLKLALKNHQQLKQTKLTSHLQLAQVKQIVLHMS